MLYPGFHAASGSKFKAYIGGSCIVKEPALTSNRYSVSDTILSRYRIYPNPSNTGIFKLQQLSPDQQAIRIEIFDLSGARITHGTYSKQEIITLNLSKQPSGIYLIRILFEGFIENIKVIKR